MFITWRLLTQNQSDAFREENDYDSDDDRGLGGFGWVGFADSDLEVSTDDSWMDSTYRLGLVEEKRVAEDCSG